MHDFVNYKASLPVESFEIESPTDWSLDLNSMAIGLALGVCACFIYLNVSQTQPASATEEPVTTATLSLRP